MKVLIIGAGTMGAGIAQYFCTFNFIDNVFVYTRRDKSAERLKNLLSNTFSKLAMRGKISESEAKIYLDKLCVVTAFDEASNVDLIVEAIAEDYESKLSLIADIKPFVGSDTIFASNTSSLSITALGAALGMADRTVGLHFFNPAPVMQLVEVVKGLATSDETIEKVVALAKSIQKTPVIVTEYPGFIVNRMLIPMINEAISILADGVASKDDIDRAMMLGANHPMGPLKLSDLIGNDVVLSIMDALYQESGDPKYRACPLLRKMVRAQHLGRKTNQGFYTY